MNQLCKLRQKRTKRIHQLCGLSINFKLVKWGKFQVELQQKAEEKS